MKKLFIITDPYGTIVEARETKAQATKRANELGDPAKGVFYTAQPANLFGIAIFGKRHTDKNGNTYNTTKTTLFFDSGKTALVKTSKQYGYEDRYVQCAEKALMVQGFFNPKENDSWRSLWLWCREYQVGYFSTFADVARERDL